MKKSILSKVKHSEISLLFMILMSYLLNSGKNPIKLASGKFMSADNIKNIIKDPDKE